MTPFEPYPSTMRWEPEPEWLPVLDMLEPARQRRWTVLLRLLLAVPQFVVLVVLEILAFFVTVFGWFAALVLGRLPAGVARFLADVLAYSIRFWAYAMLLVDRYPPFRMRAPEYPVSIEVRPDRLNRLAVLFRLILMIPAGIIQSLATSGWWAVSFISWLFTLVMGRSPRPLFGATAAVLRFQLRFSAYASMLTPAYPKRLFGERPDPGVEPVSSTRPLVLTGGAKALIVIFLIVGIGSDVTSSIVRTRHHNPAPTAPAPTGNAAVLAQGR